MESNRESDKEDVDILERSEKEKMPSDWRPSKDTIQAIEGGPVVEADIAQPQGTITDVSDQKDTKIDVAAERLKQIEWLRPEKWSQLDTNEKVIALNQAGRELAEAYHHPNPPVFAIDVSNPNTLGYYGDGYRFNRATGEIEGADYGIWMNREFEFNDKQLFGDNPAEALMTYAHEFRHSYQYEQANVYEKSQFRNLVDNDELALSWSQNLRDYKNPNVDFDAYYNQPVERDARSFAEELVRQVYGSYRASSV